MSQRLEKGRKYNINVEAELIVNAKPRELFNMLISSLQHLPNISKIVDHLDNIHVELCMDDKHVTTLEGEKSRNFLRNFFALLEYVESGWKEHDATLIIHYLNKKIEINYKTEYEIYIVKIFENDEQKQADADDNHEHIVKEILKKMKTKNTKIPITLKIELKT